MASPLANLMRPTCLEDVVGQQHILGEGKPLRGLIERKESANLIFYGPPGTGKTTVARLIAALSGKAFCPLNGTDAKTSDLQEVIAKSRGLMAQKGVLLYLDEIQYLNKKQQQVILEYMESGEITLIASTTENPYFYVYPAVLSRSVVFEFRPVPLEEIEKAVHRALAHLAKESGLTPVIDPEVPRILAGSALGDVRKALNFTEFLWNAASRDEDEIRLTCDLAGEVCISAKSRYDKDGDAHYDLLSALQKSIRGSDPDAAVHYLAKLLEAGDMVSPCRRLLVIASEDIGLAYPQAAVTVKALIDSANQLGLPEARIPLAQAAILLATAPKSNSAIMAIDAAMADLKTMGDSTPPDHLRDAHYAGASKLGHGVAYQYPHDFPHHYVAQQYLPDSLKGKRYYHYGENKSEQAAKLYWDQIKGTKGENNK